MKREHKIVASIGTAILLTAATLVTVGMSRSRQVATVTQFTWYRAVHTEALMKIHYKDTNWRRPNAYNVKHWTTSDYYNDYNIEGEWIGGHWETEDHYSYDRNEWKHYRIIQAAGVGHTTVHWPKYELQIGPLNVKNRVSITPQNYLVKAKTVEGKAIELAVPENEWLTYTKGEHIIAVYNGFETLLQFERMELAE